MNQQVTATLQYEGKTLMVIKTNLPSDTKENTDFHA